jgi:putative FmdB family regulatory protein
MPIYEYRCRNGHTLEVLQRMSDDPLSTCTTCEAPVQRVFHPVAVHFKGSGFYTTDYGKKGESSKGKSESTSKSDSDSNAKSDSKPEKSSSSDSKSKSKASE